MTSGLWLTIIEGANRQPWNHDRMRELVRREYGNDFLPDFDAQANPPLLPSLTPTHTGSMPAVNRVYHCDALTLLKALPSGSCDAIITDPPYGAEKTKCEWDKDIDLKALFVEFRRVIKARGCIAVFGAPPFSSDLIITGRDIYRYSWYYEKPRGSNFGNTAYQPLRIIEEVLIFSPSIASANQFTPDDATMFYHPPRVKLDRPYTREDKPHHRRIANPSRSSHVHNPAQHGKKFYEFATPTNLFYAAMDSDLDRGLHPTQKPTVICEYLIETYTRIDDLVIDPFAGSGSTLLAAQKLGRDWIGCDISADYCEIARRRLAMPYTLPLFAHESD